MTSGSGRCAAAILAIALASAGTSACVGSYAHRVDETEAGLIGLDARALRACLGVPTDFAIDGEREHQTYRYERDDELGAPYPPTDGDSSVVIGGGRFPTVRSYERDGFPRDEPDHSYCQLDFELTDGRVSAVSAQGRTREGMRADGTCLMRAEPCLAYADGGRAAE